MESLKTSKIHANRGNDLHGNYIFLVDIVILDYNIDFDVSIIFDNYSWKLGKY